MASCPACLSLVISGRATESLSLADCAADAAWHRGSAGSMPSRCVETAQPRARSRHRLCQITSSRWDLVAPTTTATSAASVPDTIASGRPSSSVIGLAAPAATSTGVRSIRATLGTESRRDRGAFESPELRVRTPTGYLPSHRDQKSEATHLDLVVFLDASC